MTYEEIRKSRAYESLPLSEYVACWRSVPKELMNRIQKLNWKRRVRIHFELVDPKAFAMAWRNATPEERDRMRNEIESF